MIKIKNYIKNLWNKITSIFKKKTTIKPKSILNKDLFKKETNLTIYKEKEKGIKYYEPLYQKKNILNINMKDTEIKEKYYTKYIINITNIGNDFDYIKIDNIEVKKPMYINMSIRGKIYEYKEDKTYKHYKIGKWIKNTYELENYINRNISSYLYLNLGTGSIPEESTIDCIELVYFKNKKYTKLNDNLWNITAI